jgi:hypothetical protein
MIGLVPPGRTVMFANSASGAGFSIRATGAREAPSVVSEGMPDRTDVAVFEGIVTAVGARDPALSPLRSGPKYSSGSGIQLLDWWTVPV